jgi:hypothetical protein
MPSPLNPSVTTPRQGDRSRASRVSPRNRTGQIYAQQHAEAEAKKAAANIDISEIYLRGWDAGYDAGVAAVIKQLQDTGEIDADEDELDDEAAE